MKTFDVIVSQQIEITLDPSRFTPEFMSGFNRHFHELETVAKHADYLASLVARGVVHSDSEFVEGYGVLREFGIKFNRIETWVE